MTEKLQLRDFIRIHPSIAADSYDTIRIVLENEYVMEEFKRRKVELKGRFKTLLGLEQTPKIWEANNNPIFKSTAKLI